MRNYGMARNAQRFGAWTIAVSMLMLTGCAHHMRPMSTDRTMVISGHYTANDDPAHAPQKVIVAAARMTLNHGFRYFRIAGTAGAQGWGGTPSIRPGADVTIEVYREGEIDPKGPGVRDALDVGTGELSNASHP